MLKDYTQEVCHGTRRDGHLIGFFLGMVESSENGIDAVSVWDVKVEGFDIYSQ